MKKEKSCVEYLYYILGFSFCNILNNFAFVSVAVTFDEIATVEDNRK